MSKNIPGITLFAGEYSSRNVGDGIIKLAIESLCHDHGVVAEYRDFFGNPLKDGGETAPKRDTTPGRLKQALLRSGPFKRAIATLFYLTRYKKIASRYEVRKYRRVVIGGGNLLMDNFWNFPLLILRVVKECEAASIPVSLFAVGAGRHFSPQGKRIVGRILRSTAVTHVVCRDQHSYELVSDAAGPRHAHKVALGFDCGLYLLGSAGHEGRPEKIGLGVIAPEVLRTFIPEHPMADEQQALTWWQDLVDALVSQVGIENIEILSNGSPPDNRYAEELVAALRADHPGLAPCYKASSPQALLERVGDYRALVAYRMHAAVSAMAMGVPVVGVEWDPKLKALFRYCGKPKDCVTVDAFTAHRPADIAGALLGATPADLSAIRAQLSRDFVAAIGSPMPDARSTARLARPQEQAG
ncbi:MAG TPA: polysaccharide pyruvyl transferase family protein [Burkholderiaceae bacterium]|nr:polysaccharide pyruvyl transferase family protein [Burkholderiaceae bacterium]